MRLRPDSLKLLVMLLLAGAAFGSARIARARIAKVRAGDSGAAAAPYTPSASSVRFLSLGYHEALADVLYVRLRGYIGSYVGTTSGAIVQLGEAIVALDPSFRRAYDLAANASTMAERGAEQAALHRAVALLDKGMREFPDDWSLPYLAGQIYIQDLKTEDEAQRREWDERGTMLVESALRKPGAPLQAARWAAFLRTKLGQHQRAIEGLRELLLITPEGAARKRLVQNLEALTKGDPSLVSEVLEMSKRFEQEWKANRSVVNATMYLLVGPRIEPGFDMTDLATGGRDLVLSEETQEPLEPLE